MTELFASSFADMGTGAVPDGEFMVTLKKFAQAPAANMQYMFKGAKNLKSVKFERVGEGNRADMRHMFDGAKSLSKVHFTRVGTGTNAQMSYMLSGVVPDDATIFPDTNKRKVEYDFYECGYEIARDENGDN